MHAQGIENATAIAVDTAPDILVGREAFLDLTCEQDVEPVRLVLGLPERKDIERLVEILVDIGRDDPDRLRIQGEIIAFLDRTQDAFLGRDRLGRRGGRGAQ